MGNRHRLSANNAPRLLIAEDELLVALIIEEMAHEIGYRISGVAHTAHMLRNELAKRNFDAVLLDVSLDAPVAFEFADHLIAADLPFAFVTGYDYLVEPRHESVPILQKPFTPAQLSVLLANLVGSRTSSQQVAYTA